MYVYIYKLLEHYCLLLHELVRCRVNPLSLHFLS